MSEPLTDAEVQAIRERCERATPGPWRTSSALSYVIPSHGEPYKIAQLWGTREFPGLIARDDDCLSHDVLFIANAREDIPRLLAERDRLREAVRELAGAVKKQREITGLYNRRTDRYQEVMESIDRLTGEVQAALSLPAVREVLGEGNTDG